MKYALILWYMITSPIGDSAMKSPYEEMPNVYGAAVEQLDYQQNVILLGRFGTKSTCEERASALVEQHLSSLDKTRSIKAIMYSCYQDDKQ